MTRRIVAFEGKPSIDKRLLLPCSITVKDNFIPVTIKSKVVGKATDFERDNETGAISFDIVTKEELSENLNGHMLCTAMKYHIEDDVMVIKSAVLRQIFFSEAPLGWDK